ncbi:MAG: hypothetical protein IPL33_09050 [Sphingobacteriales bacterium]|nr:hypothetical protein [Sphingobacteriales bacterium]
MKLYILRASRLCDGSGYKMPKKSVPLRAQNRAAVAERAVDNLSTFSFKSGRSGFLK